MWHNFWKEYEAILEVWRGLVENPDCKMQKSTSDYSSSSMMSSLILDVDSSLNPPWITLLLERKCSYASYLFPRNTRSSTSEFIFSSRLWFDSMSNSGSIPKVWFVNPKVFTFVFPCFWNILLEIHGKIDEHVRSNGGKCQQDVRKCSKIVFFNLDFRSNQTRWMHILP